MNTKTKKGFTLTELIIVVVIIGILAAVLIPTLTACVKKAKISNDKQLVRNLNLALSTDSLANRDGEKHKNMQEALDAAFDAGYDVSKINATKADNEILWDSKHDVFCYLNDGSIEYIPASIPSGEELNATSDGHLLFQIVKLTSGDLTNSKFSVYAAPKSTVTSITTNKGFDAGTNTNITDISYTNSGSAKDVVIRTNSASTSLTIDAASDTVKHYGTVGSLNIIAVANASYHEYGKAAFAEIATGRIVLESKSEVEHLHLTATEGNFVDITVAKASDVEMPDFSRDPVDLSSGSKLIVALQDGTNTTDAKDYVWLTEVGIYEQVTLGTADAAGTNYAAASSSQEKKDAAQQIANNITFSEGGQDYKVTATKVNDEWTYEVKTEAGQEATDYSASVSGTTVSVTNTSTSSAVQTNNENGMTPSEKEISKAENIASATVEEAAETGETKNAKAIIIISPTSEVQYATIFELRDIVNNGNDLAGYTVKLCGDIDMLGYQWLTPIGIANNNFAGTFDGQLHTISNLSNNGVATTEEVYISSTETTGNAFGLFGIVKGDVTIKNFDITVNAVYSQGEKWAAVVDEAGESNTHLTLENINVYGYLSGFDKVAGLIAESPTRKTNSSLVINNCTNYATVVGGARVAGILSGGGKQTNVRNAIIMTNVHNKGNITCSNQNTTRPEAYNVAAGICAHVNSTMAYAQEGTWFEKYPEGWTANMTLTNVTNEGTLSGMITADQLWYVFDYDSLTDDKLVIEYRLTSIGNGISSSAKEYLKEFDSHNILAGLAYETSETMVCRTAGGRQYSSIQYALAKNQSIILNCDATLDFDISCSRTIDLDGHTLTITEMQSINGGSLTFKNGTIVFENKGHFHLENYNGSSNLYLNNIAINEAGKDIIKVYGNHERNDTHLVTFDDQCNIKGNAKLYNRATALYFNEELVNQDSLNNGLFYCGE